MGQSALYDDDILIWSEEQASIIRRLGRQRRDLPNEFDIENVAEEIESVGRSELAAVESQLQNVMLHLLKIVAYPDSDAVRHWRSEISGFHSEFVRRYAPSMRQRIDLQQLWRAACEQMILALPEEFAFSSGFPESIPFGLDDLLADRLNSKRLAALIAERTKRPA